jgi:hypothetical protein
MSFLLTTDAIIDRSKTVTRRQGWLRLKVGDIVQPVRKCMGLRPGEKVERLGAPIRIVDIRREPLNAMVMHEAYGRDEVRLEGFEGHPIWGTPEGFVLQFCRSHQGCMPHTVVTRIQFEYTS